MGRVTLEWPEFAIDLLEAYYSLEGGASVQARLAKRGFVTTQFSIRHKASRLDLSSDMAEFIPLSVVADDAGVHPNAVGQWLERQDYRKHCRTWGKLVLIPLPAVRLYLATRIPRAKQRPKGWLPLKAAAAVRGVTCSTLSDDAHAGRVQAVRVGKDVYVEPTSAKNLSTTLPLPRAGLIPLGPLSLSAGHHRAAALKWCQQHGHPVTKAASRAHAYRPAAYTSPDTARAFLSARGHRQEQIETLLRRALGIDVSGMKGENHE